MTRVKPFVDLWPAYPPLHSSVEEVVEIIRASVGVKIYPVWRTCRIAVADRESLSLLGYRRAAGRLRRELRSSEDSI